jgi:hypothetical protein
LSRPTWLRGAGGMARDMTDTWTARAVWSSAREPCRAGAHLRDIALWRGEARYVPCAYLVA